MPRTSVYNMSSSDRVGRVSKREQSAPFLMGKCVIEEVGGDDGARFPLGRATM